MKALCIAAFCILCLVTPGFAASVTVTDSSTALPNAAKRLVIVADETFVIASNFPEALPAGPPPVKRKLVLLSDRQLLVFGIIDAIALPDRR